MSLLDWIGDIDKEKYKLYFVLPRKNEQTEEKIKKYGFSVIRGNFTVSVKHLYKQTCKEFFKSLLKYIYSKLGNPISNRIVVSKLKKIKPNIIHSNSFATTFGVELALKLHIPHVWHIREFMEEDHQITHFNKKKIDKYCEYSNAIFISDVIKEKYQSKFNKFSKVLLDKIEYDKDYTKKRNMFEHDECNIAIIGTISENKGQLEAIKAQQILEKRDINTCLKIIGRGPNEEFLKLYVESNKIKNIQFCGYKSNITEIRKDIDIALVCSKNEALGRVTVEGMYYKNLVIGANVGCTKYLVDDGNTGFLYENGNPEELANKIMYAMNNKEDVEKMLENAYEYAIKNFYNINYVDGIQQVYENIC